MIKAVANALGAFREAHDVFCWYGSTTGGRPCPVCGAQPWRFCVNPNGGPRVYMHRDRTGRWEKARRLRARIRRQKTGRR